MTKSHISVKNTPAQVDAPDGQKENESKIYVKCGRPILSKEINPRKRKTKGKIGSPEETHIEEDVVVEAHNEQETVENVQNEQRAPEEARVPKNCENLIC